MKEKNLLESLRDLFDKLDEVEKNISEKEGKYLDHNVHKLKLERIKLKNKIKDKLKRERNRMKKEQKSIEVCIGVGMDQIFPQYQRIIIEEDSSEIDELENKLKPKKTNTNRKNNRISLINYEGDCIWAKKSKGGDFLIYDQYGVMIEKVGLLEFQNWIDGLRSLVDSKGKSGFYPDHHADAKPGSKSLFEFVKS